jgi:hypothetical protein
MVAWTANLLETLMKILDKTIKRSYKSWKPHPLIRCYHYAAAFDNNKMIAFAGNNPIRFSAKAFKMGERFNISTYKEFPFVHAESHLVSKLLDRYDTIDTNWKIVVVRINREGRILLSKPCKNCQKILDALELYNVFYSTNEDYFTNNSNDIFYSDLTRSTILV